MRLHIYSKRNPDVPYAGSTCQRAGVLPARQYTSLYDARTDLHKLSQENAVGFEIRPAYDRLNAVWVACLRKNVKTPIPVLWQEILLRRFNITMPRIYGDFVKFNASSDEAFKIQLEFNSFINLEELRSVARDA